MNRIINLDAENKLRLAESIEITIKKIKSFQKLSELLGEKMINILENIKACYCGKVCRQFRPSKKDLKKLIEILLEIKKLECTTVEDYNNLDNVSALIKNILND